MTPRLPPLPPPPSFLELLLARVLGRRFESWSGHCVLRGRYWRGRFYVLRVEWRDGDLTPEQRAAIREQIAEHMGHISDGA